MNGIPSRVRALSALLVLFLAAPAAAQMGPAPGADPVAYAQDHLQDKVDNATADPAGYAASQANPEAVANETGHTLYLACWTAWDQTGMLLPGCEAYFVPPASFDPVDEAAATNATGNVTEVVDGLANETLDIVNDTLADPTSARLNSNGL